jgi:hypothetical protein
MKKSWITYAEAPNTKMGLVSWPYPNGYFPRKNYYKADAERLANSAKAMGGIKVRVEKEK